VSDASLSQLAADLSRLHLLLSLPDGDIDACKDPCFEAVIRRRLRNDPTQVRHLRQIATEVAMLMSA
jgi:hypothetical protein